MKILIKKIIINIGIIVILSGCATNNITLTKVIPKIPNIEKIGISWEVSSLSESPKGSFVPSIDNNNVIFAADSQGKILKIDASDGTIISKFDLGKDLSSAIAVSSQLLFVVADNNFLLAIDKTNFSIQWSQHLPTLTIEAPQVVDDFVIVRTNDSSILAYKIATGDLIWVYQRPIPNLTLRSTNTIQVVPSAKVILAGFPNGRIAVINALNGNQIWEHYVTVASGITDLDKLTDIAMRPLMFDKMICVASYNGNIGCIDSFSNNVVWSKKFSSTHQIVSDNQNIFAISQDGILYALDKTSGATIWKNDILQNRELNDPVLINNDLIIIDNEGYINLFNTSDGELIGREPSNLKGGVSFPLANGYKVIVQSTNGYLASIIENKE